MAYYSGQVANYTELKEVLIERCLDHGWALVNGILSKGKAFLKINAVTTEILNGAGSGITISGGTGSNNAILLNELPAKPRLGRVNSNSEAVTFPLNYMLHIHQNPDEVYLIVKFNIASFHYLAFGVSSIDLSQTGGTGLWMSATASHNYTGVNLQGGGWLISPTSGQTSVSNFSYSSGFFWCSSKSETNTGVIKEAIHTGINALTWATPGGGINAVSASSPHISRSPNAFNQTAPLIPIIVTQDQPSSKVSIVADINHARYVRIDNYEPEQIISLGHEKWKIYPFYLKNTSQRDGNSGTPINHTGTMGWAIRYDGS